MYSSKNNIVLLFIFIVLYTKFGDSGRGGGGRSGGGGGGKGGKSGGGGGGGRGFGSSSSGGGKGIGGFASSPKARTAAAAVAGGVVGYQGAKVARKISSGSSFMYVPTYGRTYYYGNRYYTSNSRSDIEVCRYVIDEDDDYFDLTYEDTNDKITEVIYECRSNQYCCDGFDCCDEGLPVWAILLIVAGVLIPCCYFMCCLIACLQKRKRRRLSEKNNSMEMNQNNTSYGQQETFVNTGYYVQPSAPIS